MPEADHNDPQHWPDDNPLKVKVLASQRDEFMDRTRRAKQALEDARTAFESGDMVELDRILTANTSMLRHPKLAKLGAIQYPLWCLDSGDPQDEHRYHGPFNTEAEAREIGESAERKGFGSATIRRCRRVRPSELDTARYAADSLLERFEDDAGCGGVPTEAWANWDEPLVTHDLGDERIQELFATWIDGHLRTKICICEGDEPETKATADDEELASEGRTP